MNVCIPVLKRYDLLRELLVSLQQSTIQPDVWIINNGKDTARLDVAIGITVHPPFVHTPMQPMGVAESWNWFIQHVPEERVIVNDDITFAPDSLAKLSSSTADLVWAKDIGFSCFLIRDSCVEKVGFFDESISPGYGYYEDEDYLQRLDGRGTRMPSAVAENVVCGVKHVRSATLAACSPVETAEHHRKFKIAQSNYMQKWGIVSL